MYIEYDDISNPLQFTIDTILKEAKEESRLVKQILYTMLSAYTNNPINLAINSPRVRTGRFRLVKGDTSNHFTKLASLTFLSHITIQEEISS